MNSKKNFYEIIEHTADVGLIAHAETLADLFIQAAIGMTSLIFLEGDIELEEKHHIHLTTSSKEDLLHEWLSEINYIFQVKEIICKDYKIHNINENSLEATVKGAKINIDQHTFGTEVKAVTYHQLKVQNQNNTWQAQVIFDL